jgi:hypothetical protein
MDYAIQTCVIFVLAPRVAVMGMHWLSSTPVFWPIWFSLYVVLCTSYTCIHGLLEIPHLLTLLPGLPVLPVLDINATIHSSVRSIEQFNCAIPGTEQFMLCDSPRSLHVVMESFAGILGALVFYCIFQKLFAGPEDDLVPVDKKKSE